MTLCEFVKKYPQFCIECYGPEGVQFISFTVSKEEIKHNDMDGIMSMCVLGHIVAEIEKLND